MPHFLILYRPVRPAMLTEGMKEREERIVAEHLGYLQELEKRGILALAGRTADTGEKTFGIAVFQADGAAAAQRGLFQKP